jgi:WD40 repeat protein
MQAVFRYQIEHPNAGWASTLAFSPRSSACVAGFADGTVSALRLVPPDAGHCLTRHIPGSVDAVLFPTPGAAIFASIGEFTTHMIPAALGRRVASLVHSDRVFALATSANGRLIATADAQGAVAAWKTTAYLSATPAHIALLPPPTAATPDSLALSPSHVALSARDTHARTIVWPINPTPHPSSIEHDAPVAAAAFDPNDHSLAVACQTRLAVYSPALDTLLHNYHHSAPISALAFSPDGAYLALADQHTITIIDIHAARPCLTLAFPNPVRYLAISPDDHWLAVAGDAPLAHVWELR